MRGHNPYTVGLRFRAANPVCGPLRMNAAGGLSAVAGQNTLENADGQALPIRESAGKSFARSVKTLVPGLSALRHALVVLPLSLFAVAISGATVANRWHVREQGDVDLHGVKSANFGSDKKRSSQ